MAWHRGGFGYVGYITRSLFSLVILNNVRDTSAIRQWVFRTFHALAQCGATNIMLHHVFPLVSTRPVHTYIHTHILLGTLSMIQKEPRWATLRQGLLPGIACSQTFSPQVDVGTVFLINKKSTKCWTRNLKSIALRLRFPQCTCQIIIILYFL